MKKIYIAPISKVREMETADGILSVTSADDLSNFNYGLSDEGGDGGDYARENNRNSSIWDQGW